MMNNLKTTFAHAFHQSKIYVAMALSILIFSNTGFAQTQKRFNINVRPAVNFPTKKLGDATLNVGFGFEGTIAYWFIPNLSVYAGWGWNKFQADKSFAGNSIDVVETGYRAGLQFRYPIGSSKIQYLIGAGALYNHIEIENENGDLVNDYDGHDFGWQAEGGIVVPLGERFNLTPTVRYQSLMTATKIGSVNTPVDLNYISGGVSLSFLF
jgi:hypothetical protein